MFINLENHGDYRKGGKEGVKRNKRSNDTQNNNNNKKIKGRGKGR